MTLSDFEWLFHIKFCFCTSTSSVGDCNFRKQLHVKTNKDRPILQQQECSAKNLVSGNIRFMGYSCGFLGEGASDEHLVLEMGFFSISIWVSSISQELGGIAIAIWPIVTGGRRCHLAGTLVWSQVTLC